MGQKNVNFWPIYLSKMAIFSSQKGGKIWTTLSQFFLANLLRKMSFFGQLFFRQKRGKFWTNLGQFLAYLQNKCHFFGQFLANLCKEMEFFVGKNRRQILNKFRSIFSQFTQKNGNFLGKKRRQVLNNFWVNFWPIIF